MSSCKVATSTNRRWQGKKVVPVRRRCSRGEWNVGVVGVDFETRTMPICPGMSQYELEIFANQRIVIMLPVLIFLLIFIMFLIVVIFVIDYDNSHTCQVP